jgi:hypothetical protein
MSDGNEVVTEVDKVQELDDMIEKFRDDTDAKLGAAIGNRSKTKTVIKTARREAALLQHKCRLEEDWDCVGEIRSYLKSIRTLEFGLKGNRG